jgi:cardiolipin synthase
MKELAEAPWWVITLVVIGIVECISVILTAFFALGRRPQKTWARTVPSVDSEDFLLTASGMINAPLQGGGSTELLNNGDEFFPRILEDFRNARKNINFSAYIWEPGKCSDMFFETLIERAKAGVQVRVLLDGMGGLRTPRKGIKALRAAGGTVKRFRPFHLGQISRFYKRNHRRAIVIDGRIGYTGGAAVGDKWLGNADSDEHWRDIMVRCTGCLAVNLQSAFSAPWAYVTGEILTGPDFYPDFGPQDEGNAPKKSSTENARPRIRHINVVSAPSAEEHPLRLFFILSFLAARKRLWITTPYFVPDKHTRLSVATRAKAGVDVRILLPDSHTDAVPIRLASHSYYEELLTAGVRVYEYRKTMIHSKSVVVDDDWSIVGSANMDIRSKELNQENVLGILDTNLAQTLARTFERDLLDAREITLEEWRKRSPIEHVKERFCVLFAEQY